jgi:trk/ktr system potassium uptake protein
MRILIAGGGRTGATLALTLQAQKHEVRLMEHRPNVLAHIHRELPTELIYEGNPNDPRALELARISDAQVLVASMSSDAENLSICFIARERFRVPRTIATINDPRFAWLFGPRFHVDVAVNQADILAGLIEQELSVGDMMTLLKLRKGSYSLVSETLPAEARAVGQALRDLEFPRNAVVCAILRRNDVVIPRGDVRFEAGDEVLALVDEASAPELAALFGAPDVRFPGPGSVA